jgi:hypothetical protein
VPVELLVLLVAGLPPPLLEMVLSLLLLLHLLMYLSRLGFLILVLPFV